MVADNIDLAKKQMQTINRITKNCCYEIKGEKMGMNKIIHLAKALFLMNTSIIN